MVAAMARKGGNDTPYLSTLQVQYRDVIRRYAIWPDMRIQNVGLCSTEEFDDLAVSLLGRRAPYVLRGIDRGWELDTRWWLLDLLMSERLIKLYVSRDQAAREM